MIIPREQPLERQSGPWVLEVWMPYTLTTQYIYTYLLFLYYYHSFFFVGRDIENCWKNFPIFTNQFHIYLLRIIWNHFLFWLSGKIKEICYDSHYCIANNSECYRGVCRCKAGFINTLDDTDCRSKMLFPKNTSISSVLK